MRVGVCFIFLYFIGGLFSNIAWGQQESSLTKMFQSHLPKDSIIKKQDTVDEKAPSYYSIKDTANHIIIKDQKNRKGWFSWRDSVIIPKRSAYYSLMFPGLGQINNKDYWKLPIIYGALGVGIYFYIDNSISYNEARAEYAFRLDKGGVSNDFLYPRYEAFTTTQVQEDRDWYKRWLDITVMVSVVGYALQVVEANSAAHLKGFDISDDISFKIKPSAVPSPYGIIPGIGLAFNIK
ncbi:MAG TPA: DUF5683 domain-containing protein [Edaphocola sp.]|nr:DUF5683 domain-containing protein [Edaphocola sp.]